MKIGITSRRIATVVVAIAALAALTGSAHAANNKPKGMSTAAYRALVLRSEALNQTHRLGRWKDVPSGMTGSEYRALMIRSDGLNKRYGLGRWSTSAAPRAPSGVSHGFAWGAFGIGAATMLGIVLLAAGVIAGSRFMREAPRVRTS
jgi:hypothetical protein